MKPYFLAMALALGGCAALSEPEPAPGSEPPSAESEGPPVAAKPPASRGGAYYKDDGPGDNPPPNLAELPDAEPRAEPLHRAANRPYKVFGRDYVPLAALQPFRQRGIASWYGRRFHGNLTSTGERYDMYGMTAAHPTLPLPSYARVTNVSNGRSVVVRVNDRGPFHADRIIDLSYAAAFKLGYVTAGSVLVEVETILPEAPATQVAVAQPKPTPPKPPAEERPVYLQLGAFSTRENAEDLRARIVRQLAWLTDSVQVLATGALWRLHVGPYGTSAAARSIAERIETELKLKPLIVPR